MIDIKETSMTKALKIISQHNGIIRTKDAIKEGIHPRVFYKLRDQGVIEEISRGLYRLSSIEANSEPDITTVALKYPNAVICLISALSYYNITTQIPHMVYIALKKGAETPRIDYPPVSVHRFSEDSFKTGIVEKEIDGIKINIYSPEKTIADCFKFRNKIGLDVALEALKLYKANYKFNMNKLMRYAKVCRVYNIIKPYLEATI